MDFGSLDFGTWRLVALVILAVGALATVIAIVAIVAIVAMFRGGSTGDDHGHAEAESDEDDEEPHAAEPTEVTAAATRGADSGPTAVPVGLSGPQDDLFTMSANASPRKSMPSTGDEPHVPSPDWYEYPDVIDAESAGGDVAVDDLDDYVIAAFVATRQADPPFTPPATSTAPEQPVAPVGQDPRRRTSGWFDDIGDSDIGSPTLPARHSDTQSAPTAVSPMNFPWERRREATSVAEPPVAPAPEESERPTAGTVEAEPTATSRHSDADTTTPNPAEHQEPDSPPADWYDDPDGSGGERWWDGKGWTRRRRPRSGSPVTDNGQGSVDKP